MRRLVFGSYSYQACDGRIASVRAVYCLKVVEKAHRDYVCCSSYPHPMRYIFHFGRYAPRELTGPYSAELKDLVYRCLERNPHLRPYPRDLLSHPFFEKRTSHWSES